MQMTQLDAHIHIMSKISSRYWSDYCIPTESMEVNKDECHLLILGNISEKLKSYIRETQMEQSDKRRHLTIASDKRMNQAPIQGGGV